MENLRFAKTVRPSPPCIFGKRVPADFLLLHERSIRSGSFILLLHERSIRSGSFITSTTRKVKKILQRHK
jgi:hypothetical protein